MAQPATFNVTVSTMKYMPTDVSGMELVLLVVEKPGKENIVTQVRYVMFEAI